MDKKTGVEVDSTEPQINNKLRNSCRICMNQDIQMKYIFDKDSNIIENILYCTGLKFTMEDGLPSQICDGCLQDLKTAHKFKETCLLSNNTFHSLIKAGIKVEPSGTVDELSDEWDNEDGVSSIKDEADEEADLHSEIDERKAVVVKKKLRGPYKKNSKPRLKKLKFKRLWCEPCSLRFTKKTDLEEHRRELHGNCEESWVCEMCGKVFSHRGSLSSHIRSHLPPRFACDQCDYKTWNKYDLKKHLLIHTGEKIYQCQHCTAAFYTNSNMSSHIRRFHDGEKNYACDMCERRFFDRTKFNRHVDSHNNVKRFECEVCHSCFTRRCYWKKHLHRQHNIVVPAQRPGKQKVNFIVGKVEGGTAVVSSA